MNKRYLFLDVDMTLYSPVIADVPQSAQYAIKEARRNGSKVFLCTGRSLGECAGYLGYEVDGFVFAAGAMIYADGKRIYDAPISSRDVYRLKHFLHSHGLGYSAEGTAGCYCDEKAYEVLLRYFAGGEKPRPQMVEAAMRNGCYPEMYEHDSDAIYKLCGFPGEHNYDFEELKRLVPQPYQLAVTLRNSKVGDGCEITDSRITKATGIARVLEHYGAEVYESVGIGDSQNDISMIEYCGTGIAMGNAFEEVKQIADFVTTDILDDGILNAFRHVGVL